MTMEAGEYLGVASKPGGIFGDHDDVETRQVRWQRTEAFTREAPQAIAPDRAANLLSGDREPESGRTEAVGAVNNDEKSIG